MNRLPAALGATVFAVLAVACSQKPATSTDGKSDVVAVVDGVVITRKLYDEYVKAATNTPQEDLTQKQREGLDETPPADRQAGTRQGQHRGDEPDDTEKDIAPDHAHKEKCRRRERDQQGHQAEPRHAPHRDERKQTKTGPIQRGRQQEHAQRAGRDRVDEPP